MKPFEMKWLSILAIVLFLGIAFAPSVHSSAVNDDLVQFHVELSGLEKNYTVSLTRQQAQDVYAIFDNLKQRLSGVTSRDETNEIFTEAVENLSCTGLLGNVSVAQALELVLQPKTSPGLHRTTPSLPARARNLSANGNYFCSVAADLSDVYFCGTSLRALNLLMTLPFFIFHKLGIGTFIAQSIARLMDVLAKLAEPLINFLDFVLQLLLVVFDPLIVIALLHFLAVLTIPFWFVLYLIALIPTGWTDIPWIIMNIYFFKIWPCNAVMVGSNDRYGPSEGWVDTVGTNGNVNWNGSLYGQLPLLPMVVVIPQVNDLFYYFPGMMGFRGLSIQSDERQGWSFLGSAVWVNLGSEYPQNPWI
jgi:hypothetical protein